MLLRRARPAWLDPAGVLRKLLDNMLRRRTIVTESGELATLRGASYAGDLAPAIDEAPTRIRQMLTRLATAGGLDEGNAGLCDPTIAQWVEQWGARIDEQHRANQTRLQDYENSAVYRLTRARAELAAVEDELQRVAALLDEFALRWPDAMRAEASPARRRRGIFRRR